MSRPLTALLRTGASDTAQMSRVLGVLYLSGGLLVFLSLQLPHPESAVKAGLYGITAVGATVGSAGLLWAKHARRWTIHVVLAAGTGFISLCVFFSSEGAGIYSAMFVWVVLMAATFFSGRALAAHVGWILVAWAVALSAVEETSGFSVVTRWALGSFVLVVAAVVMGELVAGRRATEKERERLQRELEHLAHHDPLTGLANRRLFETTLTRELARAKRHEAPVSIVALDLDHFKQYNDEHGHLAGDRLLKLAASAWTSALRGEDVIARFGGDEFVALLPDAPRAEADRIAQRLCGDVPLGCTCSTGIASWDGHQSADELLARADAALYEAKSERRMPRLQEGRTGPA